MTKKITLEGTSHPVPSVLLYYIYYLYIQVSMVPYAVFASSPLNSGNWHATTVTEHKLSSTWSAQYQWLLSRRLAF